MDKDKVFVFVDNSNIWIEGKKAVSSFEFPGLKTNDSIRIEYGKLVETVVGKRTLGQPSVVFGSRPPENDSLWRSIRENNCSVVLQDRNSRNKEKAVDVSISSSVTETIILHRDNPGTLVLVTGDSDFEPLIGTALKYKWNVEVWFWTQGKHNCSLCHSENCQTTQLCHCHAGFATRLQQRAQQGSVTICKLDEHYKTFTFAEVERPPASRQTFHLSNGDTIRSLTRPQLLNFFSSKTVDLFCCHSKLNERTDDDGATIELYVPKGVNFETFAVKCEQEFPSAKLWHTQN